MKKKNGFTLVELLAVIAILAILVIIALPNVMGLFTEAKKKAFTTEVKEIFKVAEETWMSESMFTTDAKTYSRCANECTNGLNLTGRNEIEYSITVDKNGKVVEYYATDGTYQYIYDGDGLRVEEIDNDIKTVADLDEDHILEIAYDDTSSASGNVINGSTIDLGINVNKTFKSLAGISNPRQTTADTNIKAIKRANSLPDDSTTVRTISSSNSLYPVYAWYKDNTIYLYTEGKTIHLNKDASYTFAYLEGLESLNMNMFDTSNVTNMDSLFKQCSSLTSLNVSNLKTRKVTNMNEMFIGCSNVTSLDVSNFITSNVTNMTGMFSTCSSLTRLDLSNFNTSKVKTMAHMFYNDKELTYLDTSSFDTSNVTNMAFMFDDCEKMKSLDVSNFDTSNVTDMHSMFDHNFALVTIYVTDKWSNESVTNSQHMFRYCPKLKGSKGSTTSNGTDATFARIDDAPDNPGYFTYKTN